LFVVGATGAVVFDATGTTGAVVVAVVVVVVVVGFGAPASPCGASCAEAIEAPKNVTGTTQTNKAKA
jgi:hypothetical protein